MSRMGGRRERVLPGPVALDLPRRDDHSPGCGVPVRAARRGKRRALVLLLVHVLIAAHVAHWMATGRSLTPLEPSEAGVALSTGAVNAGLVLLVLLVLSTFFFGRFFCGWACHLVAYQDACAWLLGKLGLRPRAVRSRALALVPLFVAFDMFALPLVRRLSEGHGLPALAWHFTTESFWERFPGPGMAALTFVVCGFAVVWAFGAKGFCAYACPYGALFGLADRKAKRRIRVTNACEGCGHCTAVCTSNVRVHEEVARFGMVVDSGCMKCTDCVSACPKDALFYGKGPSRRAALAGARPARSWDFTGREELALAAVFLAALYAWRGLYEAVPFLLAVALAVLAALAAVLAWRLVRGGELSFQHWALRRGGRWSGRGIAAFVLALGFLALTAHSGLVQAHLREGDRRLSDAAAASDPAARAEALRASEHHLARVARLALVDTHGLHDRLGQVSTHLGRYAAAERHLRRAVELLPESRSARIYLARLLIARGAHDEAYQVLARLWELAPEEPFLAATLEALVRSAPDHAAAAALLERARPR